MIIVFLRGILLKAQNNSALIKNKLIFLVVMPVFGLILISLIFSLETYNKHVNLDKLVFVHN